MYVVYSHCRHIDVHEQTAVACVIPQGPSGRPTKEIRTFGTMNDELLSGRVTLLARTRAVDRTRTAPHSQGDLFHAEPGFCSEAIHQARPGVDPLPAAPWAEERPFGYTSLLSHAADHASNAPPLLVAPCPGDLNRADRL